MSYPFVPAPDHWPRTAPIRAIAIHMAEGGGTVGWLQRPDGNSSHYVVERTGRVVQMVRENRAAGSIDPTKVRRNDDPAFTYLGESITYGVTANRAALGPHWANPNAAVIAIEVEGFARSGPNAAQRGPLRTLVADIRSRHPGLPALGHRDWQNYKACPGKLIPWADYGGHGAAPQEEDVPGLAFRIPDPHRVGSLTVSVPGASLVTVKDLRVIDVPVGDQRPTAFAVELLTPLEAQLGRPTVPGDRQSGYLIGKRSGEPANSQAAFVLASTVKFDPAGDCANEVAAQRERDRVATLAAVEEVYS